MSALYGIELSWAYQGNEVYVAGSWSNWQERVKLNAEKRVWLQLPRGIHRYKFIVDGRWCYDMLRPLETDDCGNINNVLSVPSGEVIVHTLPLVLSRRDEVWGAERESCVKSIAKYRPAVICTQRGQHDQLAYVCQRAGPYRRTGMPQGGNEGDFCAVLWDSVQLRHVASGDFWLSPKPNQPGSRFPDAPEACMATWALLKPYQPTEPAVFVCSTALNSPGSNEELRVKQGAVLIEQLEQLLTAVTSGAIRDKDSQSPMNISAVVLAGCFGEPMLTVDGKERCKLFDMFARKGFCDCIDASRSQRLPEFTEKDSISSMHKSSEDWMLVLKRVGDNSPRGPPSPSSKDISPCTDASAAQLPISWMPNLRTDVVEFSVPVDKAEMAHPPGCENNHFPLSATFVMTEIPFVNNAK